jgi:hydrogenase maturation factor
MNLLYGQIVEIASEDGMRVAKIQVAGAFKKISLELIGDARIGDRVLVCDGIALSKDDSIHLLSFSEQQSSAPEGQYSKASPILQYTNTPPAGLQDSNEASNEPGPRIF